MKQRLRKSKDSKWILVGTSSIQGRGVYAKTDIKKGTRIVEYGGEKITKAESDRRADRRKHVFIFTLNTRYDLDGARHGNDARFINHGCAPNCESDIVRGKVYIYALKKIKEGQELTYDYNFDLEDMKDHPCKCGTKKCRKFIVGEEHWVKHLRKRAKKKAAKKSKGKTKKKGRKKKARR